jgi:hypothetical protein
VRITSKVVKEIQRLISVACLAALPRRESSSVKKTDLEDEVFHLFHGKTTVDDPSLDKKLPAKDACATDKTDLEAALAPGDSFVSMFFEGRNQFASAFTIEEHPIGLRYSSNREVVPVGKTTRRHLLPQLVSTKSKKSEVYFEGPSAHDDVTVDHGFDHIFRKCILSKWQLQAKTFNIHDGYATSKEAPPEFPMITGANIFSLGKAAIENCQQAAKFGAEFLAEGQLPPGKTATDYFDHVLDEMYRCAPLGSLKFCINDNGKREPLLSAQSAEPAKTRPADWFFHGWMAFYLFGPMAEPELQCRLLEPGKFSI